MDGCNKEIKSYQNHSKETESPYPELCLLPAGKLPRHFNGHGLHPVLVYYGIPVHNLFVNKGGQFHGVRLQAVFQHSAGNHSRRSSELILQM